MFPVWFTSQQKLCHWGEWTWAGEIGRFAARVVDCSVRIFKGEVHFWLLWHTWKDHIKVNLEELRLWAGFTCSRIGSSGSLESS